MPCANDHGRSDRESEAALIATMAGFVPQLRGHFMAGFAIPHMDMANMLDTSQIDLPAGPAAEPRSLSPSMRRALEIRVDALSAEQRRDAEEVEHLYARSNALTLQILERQRQLRHLREILLNRRAA